MRAKVRGWKVVAAVFAALAVGPASLAWASLPHNFGPPPSTSPPAPPPHHVPPPYPPPPHPGPPPIVSPPGPPMHCHGTPEPTALLSGLIGVGFAGLYGLRQGRRAKKA